jgi:cholesterol oxidase
MMPGDPKSANAPVAPFRGKARSPRAILSPAVVADGRLTCAVSFDAGNGLPEFALLLPMTEGSDGWAIVLRDETLAAFDAPFELGAVDLSLKALKPGDTLKNAVTLSMRWPLRAGRALLVLIHPQLDAIGDESYIAPVDVRLPPVAAVGGVGPATALQRVADATQAYLREASSLDVERGLISAGRSAAGASSCAAAPRCCRFALASSQYPAGMFDGGSLRQRHAGDDSAIGPAERSLWRLGKELEQDLGISFTVLAGDQVHADAIAGLFDPANLLDRFCFAYESLWQNRGLQRVLRVANHTLFPLLDDHELAAENWEPRSADRPDREQATDLRLGVENYRRWQAAMWPAPPRDRDALWEPRTVGGMQFFFADTRTLRTGRDIANWREASILGDTQESALLEWIAARAAAVEPVSTVDEGTPRFIVSPSMLLPRRLSMRNHPTACLAVDSWCGYPRSLHAVLAHIHETQAHGIVFLSGDQHLGCVARIVIERSDAAKPAVVTHAVNSPALYAPYPSANSVDADFAAHERFEFEYPASDGGGINRYICDVATTFSSGGDGFVILSPESRVPGAWQLGVRFIGADGRVQLHRCELQAPVPTPCAGS